MFMFTVNTYRKSTWPRSAVNSQATSPDAVTDRVAWHAPAHLQHTHHNITSLIPCWCLCVTPRHQPSAVTCVSAGRSHRLMAVCVHVPWITLLTLSSVYAVFCSDRSITRSVIHRTRLRPHFLLIGFDVVVSSSYFCLWSDVADHVRVVTLSLQTQSWSER